MSWTEFDIIDMMLKHGPTPRCVRQLAGILSTPSQVWSEGRTARRIYAMAQIGLLAKVQEVDMVKFYWVSQLGLDLYHEADQLILRSMGEIA